MKKFILGGAFAAALVLGAAYSYNYSSKSINDLCLANVEALSDCECCGIQIEVWCKHTKYDGCNFLINGKTNGHPGWEFK